MEVKYFKPWILFFIVASVGGAIAGFFAGFIVGVVMSIAGVESLQMHAIAGGAAGYIVGIPISFIVYKWSVNKFILNQLKAVPVKEDIQPAN